MLLNEIRELAEIYDVPFEDVLFIYFSIKGINAPVDFARGRFLFHPQHELFQVSKKRKIDSFFFALPIWHNSLFQICNSSGGQILTVEGVEIGTVTDLYNDTCDSEYTRNNGKVLNLNPVSKSQCRGCKFCHTVVQQSNETKDTKTCGGLEAFLQDWMLKKQLSDLSHLIQVAIVTGTFGGSLNVIDYTVMVRQLFSKYQYSGELFYFGAEIDVSQLINNIELLKPFAWCYTVECFENRRQILKKEKAALSLDEIFASLELAASFGVKTNFSYILGIDSLDAIEKNFSKIKSKISRFPIINIFQPHANSATGILHEQAVNIEYYLKARKIIEDIFKDTALRPRTWENYRSPWFLTFADEELSGNRLP